MVIVLLFLVVVLTYLGIENIEGYFMNLDLIRIVLDEMRTIIDEYNYRIDEESRFLVHPRHKFAQLSDVQSLINGKRRVMSLRESFIGKLMVESTSDTDLKDNPFKTLVEETREKNEINHARRVDAMSDERLGNNMDKMRDVVVAQKLTDKCRKDETSKEEVEEVIKEYSVEKLG